MTAQEAKKIADQYKENEKEYTKVIGLIGREARKGYYQLFVGKLSSYTIDKLKSNGYTLRESKNWDDSLTDYTIEWL
jgi:hypothetical protein